MAASTEPFGLSQIGQISVRVRDVKKGTAFYHETLGMKLLFETLEHGVF